MFSIQWSYFYYGFQPFVFCSIDITWLQHTHSTRFSPCFAGLRVHDRSARVIAPFNWTPRKPAEPHDLTNNYSRCPLLGLITCNTLLKSKTSDDVIVHLGQYVLTINSQKLSILITPCLLCLFSTTSHLSFGSSQ